MVRIVENVSFLSQRCIVYETLDRRIILHVGSGHSCCVEALHTPPMNALIRTEMP